MTNPEGETSFHHHRSLLEAEIFAQSEGLTFLDEINPTPIKKKIVEMVTNGRRTYDLGESSKERNELFDGIAYAVWTFRRCWGIY